MILKKLDETYHWKLPLAPLTGSEFEWNNWAVHESEDEPDDEGKKRKKFLTWLIIVHICH